jgi:uncharacterized protein
VLLVLDAAAVRGWCAAGLEALRAAREEIDDLNVYPVPDGDTGTNLLLTMEQVAEAVAAAGPGPAETAAAVARGSLLGARGNSGVILSQLLRGLCEELATGDTDGAGLARGLRRASELAYEAVAAPVEGTVLTVARAAADAAGAAGSCLADVVAAARAAAAAALAATPDQLPALRDAGVVDAGGRGLCVLLEALEAVVTGRAPDPLPRLHVPRDRSGLTAAREAGSPEFGYEVQYLLCDSDDDRVARLRQELGDLGDSLVVVGSEGTWNVHVHVNDVGAAMEAGVAAGRPARITVTRFEDQVDADRAPVMNERPTARAVVAVAPGAGLAALFEAAGATVVDRRPSTADVLAAVHRTGAREVVVLPNDPDVRAVADAAAGEAAADGLSVRIVATRSPLQGLAAVAVDDPAVPFAEAVDAMAQAADGVRWAEVAVAVRAATTAAGRCEAGDVLGLCGGEVVLLGSDVETVARELLDRLLSGGGELATLVAGSGAPAGVSDRLAAHVADRHPGVELVVYDGGQPHPPLLLGVE